MKDKSNNMNNLLAEIKDEFSILESKAMRVQSCEYELANAKNELMNQRSKVYSMLTNIVTTLDRTEANKK